MSLKHLNIADVNETLKLVHRAREALWALDNSLWKSRGLECLLYERLAPEVGPDEIPPEFEPLAPAFTAVRRLHETVAAIADDYKHYCGEYDVEE